MNNYLVFDIENNNTNLYKRNAGNFRYDEIVAIGLKDSNKLKAIYTYKQTGFNYNFISKYSILIAHNAKHDLLFLWKDEKLQDWFKKGGVIHDTQLAEYYLTSFESKYAALREIGVNKYKCSIREKLMESYWDKGLQTSDIPKDLVLIDVQGDVCDTEQIYLEQQKQIISYGLENVLKIQMDALLATTEMEYNGFSIDVQRLKQNKLNLEIEIKAKTERYEILISQHIDINYYKEKPKLGLHTLFFGGIIPRKVKIPAKDNQGLPLFIKSGQNKGKLKYINHEYTETCLGLGLNVKTNWKTEKGNISLNEAVIAEIRDETSQLETKEICQLLLDIRGLEKSLSTYFISIEELIWPDNTIHGKFNHCATETGRSSSNHPNMQNIPGSKKSTAKQHFISRYL